MGAGLMSRLPAWSTRNSRDLSMAWRGASIPNTSKLSEWSAVTTYISEGEEGAGMAPRGSSSWGKAAPRLGSSDNRPKHSGPAPINFFLRRSYSDYSLGSGDCTWPPPQCGSRSHTFSSTENQPHGSVTVAHPEGACGTQPQPAPAGRPHP